MNTRISDFNTRFLKVRFPIIVLVFVSAITGSMVLLGEYFPALLFGFMLLIIVLDKPLLGKTAADVVHLDMNNKSLTFTYFRKNETKVYLLSEIGEIKRWKHRGIIQISFKNNDTHMFFEDKSYSARYGKGVYQELEQHHNIH